MIYLEGGLQRTDFPKRKQSLLHALIIRWFLVPLDAEETNTTAFSVVFLGNIASGERGVVTQRSQTVSVLWDVSIVGVALLFVDSLDVLLVGISNVGGTSDKENQEQTSNGSPSNGQRFYANMALQTLTGESVSSQDNNSSLEGGCSRYEKESNHNQEHKNLVNNSEAESQERNKQSKARESESQKEESKSKSGQVVVGVSAVDKIGWHTAGGVEIINWRDWISWTSVAIAKIIVITNTPECPS